MEERPGRYGPIKQKSEFIEQPGCEARMDNLVCLVEVLRSPNAAYLEANYKARGAKMSIDRAAKKEKKQHSMTPCISRPHLTPADATQRDCNQKQRDRRLPRPMGLWRHVLAQWKSLDSVQKLRPAATVRCEQRERVTSVTLSTLPRRCASR
jgi:hypothetical protein